MAPASGVEPARQDLEARLRPDARRHKRWSRRQELHLHAVKHTALDRACLLFHHGGRSGGPARIRTETVRVLSTLRLPIAPQARENGGEYRDRTCLRVTAPGFEAGVLPLGLTLQKNPAGGQRAMSSRDEISCDEREWKR